MAQMLMSVTREEALENAITCVKMAQAEMVRVGEGDSEVDPGTAEVRGWADVADTWVSIAKELPGGPRPEGERQVAQLVHLFPEGPVKVEVKTEAA